MSVQEFKSILPKINQKTGLNILYPSNTRLVEPFYKNLGNILKNFYDFVPTYNASGYFFNIGDPVSRFLSQKLYNRKIREFLISIVKFDDEFEKKLKDNFEIDNEKGIALQNPLIDTTNKKYKEIAKNNFIETFDLKINKIVKRLHKKLYDDIVDAEIANIQLFYMSNGENDIPNFFYTGSEIFDKDVDIDNIIKDIKINYTSSASSIIFLGIRISYGLSGGKTELDEDQLEDLKAYHPSTNKEYHRLTCVSTSVNSKLCIYESFLDISNIKTLKFMKRNKKNHDMIMNMLKNEGKDIESSVKNGKLVESLRLLTKKYENEVNIIFYGDQIKGDKDGNIDIENKPININNGEVKIMKKMDDIRELENKKVMLYEKNIHVAPHIFSLMAEKEINKINMKKEVKFILKPSNVKNYKKISGILGYDIETYLNEKKEAIPFCICVYGELNNNIVDEYFYGKSCVSKFVDYLETIKTGKNNKKNSEKVAIPPIYIYGFNNANFDNLLVYNEIYKKEPSSKYIFTGSTIKCMEYNNIKIFDISLQYKAGTLRKTCEAFKLEEEKGVFPYRFPNKDNLNYIGSVPELNFWNSDGDYKEYVSLNGNKLDLKNYCIKYCRLDSKLVYDLAKIHINNSRGEINGKKYDVVNCPTSANVALKMFRQCFLNENLYQSPENIIDYERKAYKGGRTEVFKKYFNGDLTGEKLYYYDINSSYPSSMTKEMPYKYVKTLKYKDHIIKKENIISYNLYLAKFEYKGNDKNFIPNLLIREHKSNSIIAVKNSDYNYQWGCELIEAIENNCEIKIREQHVYESKTIF